jgi:LacI family repressor for deo operon, udp, cdd, tsx, nupC, and nupG
MPIRPTSPVLHDPQGKRLPYALTRGFFWSMRRFMDEDVTGEVKRRRRRAAGAGRPGAMHIAEVARLAGVSIATVSRALGNPERVNAATRERVLEVVRRTGYTPNVAGRSLRAARSMMVLIMIPTFITPFFNDLLLGVERALWAHGYGLLISNLFADAGKERRLVDLVLAGQADGVLLLDGKIPQGAAASLVDAGVPMVAVGVPVFGHDLPAVLVENCVGGIAMARHLLALGHRRFGYVTGPDGNYSDAERWAGFSATLAEAGIDPTAVLRYPGTFHVESGVEAGRAFLASAPRPTAVFAASDMMAIGFMRAMHEAGLTIPGDVSVAGFDGIEFADYCEPPLTTIRQPREAMGKAAAELLIRVIRGEVISATASRIQLGVTLRPAASTAPPGGAAAERRRA